MYAIVWLPPGLIVLLQEEDAVLELLGQLKSVTVTLELLKVRVV